MKPIDILQGYFDVESNSFDSVFIQMFVETDSKFNYGFFNKFFEQSFTHSDINNAINELSGSKVIKFLEVETDPKAVDFLHNKYTFGKFPNVRGWIDYIAEQTGYVISRAVLFSWVASQHPPKQQSSFLPTNDRNLYGKETTEPAA